MIEEERECREQTNEILLFVLESKKKFIGMLREHTIKSRIHTAAVERDQEIKNGL